MDEFDLVIRGGTVVTATDISDCDVGIRDGVVAALGRNLSKASEEFDAGGKLVLPGGVDSHAHIEQLRPNGIITSPDDFESATRSAAFGGTTSVLCFAPQFKGGGIADNVADYARRAETALVDYGFHLVVTDPRGDVLENEFAPLIEAGHRSLKIFMTYDANVVSDPEIIKVLAFARRHGAMVAVHAENHDAIAWMIEALEASGNTAPKYHGNARPALVEREAVHRVIALAELCDTPIQIFHVSCAEAAEEVRKAQERGLKVFAETCPHYLTFTADDLDRDGTEGAKYLCSPPLRTKEDQTALWHHLRLGTLTVVSSDHAAHQFCGAGGKSEIAASAPFSRIPNGSPGLETRLPHLFSEGVLKGRIDLNHFVALTATNPARQFGLYPRKGSIAVGMDADIAIWDPSLRRVVRNSELHHKVDHNLLEGVELTGWPVATLVRGKFVVRDDSIQVQNGYGRLIRRERYPAATPLERFPSSFNPYSR